MKERPILYSTPMVQAKLAGRKTQTRRIIKESSNGCLTNGGPHPCPNEPVVIYPGETYESPCTDEKIFIDSPEVRAVFHCSTLDSVAKCPYGKIGDLLWGRESFWSLGFWEPEYVDGQWSGKDWNWKERSIQFDKPEDITVSGDYESWRHMPSIFLKKKHARIWERITNIRVERLQNISEADAIAEGVVKHWYDDHGESPGRDLYYVPGCTKDGFGFTSAVEAYKDLWESINGPGSCDLNPWVWIIETDVLSTTGRPLTL